MSTTKAINKEAVPPPGLMHYRLLPYARADVIKAGMILQDRKNIFITNKTEKHSIKIKISFKIFYKHMYSLHHIRIRDTQQ